MKTLILTLVWFSLYTAGFCKTWTIINTGFTYNPATITIAVGDSVNFSIASIHDAVEVSQATWNSNGTTPLPGFSVPFGGGLVFPAQLTVGTHYYVCTNHAFMGMKGIIIAQDPTGIIENSLASNISIYPNPSNGKFQLEIKDLLLTKDYYMKIYDIQGKMLNITINYKYQNSNIIDLSGFSNGIYFIRFYNDAEIYDKKFVIQ